jgi:hypothetical protein
MNGVGVKFTISLRLTDVLAADSQAVVELIAAFVTVGLYIYPASLRELETIYDRRNTRPKTTPRI